MNKKLLSILAILIVVGSVSAVSAFDLGDIFGSGNEKQTVTIEGLKFNIPEGYNETKVPDNVSSIFDMFNENGGNLTVKSFTKNDDDTKVITITVAGNLSDSEMEFFGNSNGNKTTIAGINGTLNKELDDVTVFTYQKDGKAVSISTAGNDVIEEVLKV